MLNRVAQGSPSEYRAALGLTIRQLLVLACERPPTDAPPGDEGEG